jgi:uncharacterized protein
MSGVMTNIETRGPLRSKGFVRTLLALRLLLVFTVLEFVVGPRMWILQMFYVSAPPTWLRIPGLLVLALILVRFVARLKLSEIGLSRWNTWPQKQKAALILLFIIANVIFIFVFASRLTAIVHEPGLPTDVWTIFVPYLIWGFYQELVYRGILQTALARLWGAPFGILVSNLLFTFGPLHFSRFLHPVSALPAFASVFCIGLFFAITFAISKNLWLVGLLHGVGNIYTDAIWVH